MALKKKKAKSPAPSKTSTNDVASNSTAFNENRVEDLVGSAQPAAMGSLAIQSIESDVKPLLSSTMSFQMDMATTHRYTKQDWFAVVCDVLDIVVTLLALIAALASEFFAANVCVGLQVFVNLVRMCGSSRSDLAKSSILDLSLLVWISSICLLLGCIAVFVPTMEDDGMEVFMGIRFAAVFVKPFGDFAAKVIKAMSKGKKFGMDKLREQLRQPRDTPICVTIKGKDKEMVRKMGADWTDAIDSTILFAEMELVQDGAKHWIAAIFVDIEEDYLVYAANWLRVKRWLQFGVQHVTLLQQNEKEAISPAAEIECIQHLLIAPKDDGGANLNALFQDPLVDSNHITVDYFPIHDRKACNMIMQQAFDSIFFSDDLLVSIGHLLGDNNAMYFAFITQYSKWLLGLSLIGVPVWCLRFHSHEAYFIGCASFGVFTSLWATMFLECWERDMSRLSHFGLGNLPAAEHVRENFRGEERENPVTGIWEQWYPPERAFKKKLQSIAILAGLFSVVLVSCLGLFYLYMYLDHLDCGFYQLLSIQNNPLSRLVFQTVGSNLLWAILLEVVNFNVIYVIAVRTSNWENPKTQSLFETTMAYKITTFFLLDVFSWYYCLAFIWIPYTRGYDLGMYDTLDYLFSSEVITGVDVDIGLTMDEQVARATRWMLALGDFIQFFCLVVQLWALAAESFIPALLLNLMQGKMRMNQFTQEEISIDTSRSKLMLQEKSKAPYVIMYDLGDMCIMSWGMVVLFSVACPLAPLLCFLNNVLECKTDLAKLCSINRRPWPQKRQGFEPWQSILRSISFLSIFMNSAMIMLCQPTLELLMGCGDTVEATVRADLELQYCISWQVKLLAAFVVQNLTGASKLLIHFGMPKLPADIKLTLEKQEWKEKQAKITNWTQLGLLKSVKGGTRHTK